MRKLMIGAFALALLGISAGTASAYHRHYGYYGYSPLNQPFPQWGYAANDGCPRYDRHHHRWYRARCTYPWPYAEF
jgi:hypothetical protein